MRQLAPDLWQLRGLPPNAINVYLAGDVLIDAGTRLAHRRIDRELGGRSISALALTHVHPDHQGSAHAICSARDVPLACHAAGVDVMEGHCGGRPELTTLQRFLDERLSGPPHPVARALEEGNDVAGFRVIHAPGHADSEVILFRDSDRVAICGDVVNTMNLLTMRPGIREPPDAFTTDAAQNRQSIRELAELEPTLICAGHGPPTRDLAGLRKLAASFG